jgi:glycosyltransferase involved in cell wall biosynthesis
MSIFEAPLRLVDTDAMPAAPPLISCLMVTRGRLFPTQFAIDCYRRQTWPNRELIIVCDDADSELPGFVAGLGDPTIRYVHTAPAILGALRNVSVEAARGMLVCQWDDDDLYHPERLEYQYGQLVTARRAAAHVLSRWVMWWPERRRIAISNNRLWEGSMLARRLAISYPELVHEDTHLLRNMREQGNRVAHTDQPFAYCYIVHGSNTFNVRHYERIFANATEHAGPDEYAERLEQLGRVFPLHAYREALVRLGRAV